MRRDQNAAELPVDQALLIQFRTAKANAKVVSKKSTALKC